MARRRSNFSKRLESIRGLTAPEKNLFRRIGEVIDGAVNNRGPSNAEIVTTSRNRDDVRLPPVKGIEVKTGVRTAIISWSPADSSILLHYKVQIQNTDTNEIELDQATYTSRIIFKGRPTGHYKVTIRAIGRNGTGSRAVAATFEMNEHILALEGTKNGVISFSTFVGEEIKTTLGSSVTIFGAFVVDSLAIAGLGFNPIVELRVGPTFETSTLIEQRRLFGRNESASSYNDSSFNPAITRPAFANRSVLESSHSLIFEPFLVTEDMVSDATAFWIQVTGSAAPDIVSLSIVVWMSSLGAVTDEDAIRVHTKCLSLTGSRAWRNYLQATDNWGARWSFAVWLKPTVSLSNVGCFFGKRSRFSDDCYTGTTTAIGARVHQRQAYARAGIGPLAGLNTNDVPVGDPNFRHSVAAPSGLFFETWPDTSSAANFIGGAGGDSADLVFGRYIYNPLDQTGATDYSQIWNLGLNQWYFWVFTWTDVKQNRDPARLTVFRNGYELMFTQYDCPAQSIGGTQGSNGNTSEVSWPYAAWQNTGILGDPENHAAPAGPGPSSPNTFDLRTIYQGVKIHKLGIWNKALTPADVRVLYNSHDGGEIDYRDSQGAYSNSSLLVYEEFGRDSLDLSGTNKVRNLAEPNFDIRGDAVPATDPEQGLSTGHFDLRDGGSSTTTNTNKNDDYPQASDLEL